MKKFFMWWVMICCLLLLCSIPGQAMAVDEHNPEGFKKGTKVWIEDPNPEHQEISGWYECKGIAG